MGCKGRFRFIPFVSVFQGSLDVERQSSPVIEMHSKINGCFIHNSIKYEHLFSERLAIQLLLYIRGEVKVMYTYVLFNNCWGKKYRRCSGKYLMHFTTITPFRSLEDE